MSPRVLYLLALLVGVSWDARAAGIDSPERYVIVDLAVRQVTVEGMSQRLSLRQRGADAKADAELDAATQERIRQIYHQHETTAAAHAFYGTRNAAAIRAWLDAHADSKKRHAVLEQAFQALDKQLQATR